MQGDITMPNSRVREESGRFLTGWPGILGYAIKTNMENLKTEPIKIQGDEGMEEYLLKEKDHGDLVVYDIYRKDHYLLTLAKDGSILFMNFDADAEDKEIFKLSHLHQFIEHIQAVS